MSILKGLSVVAAGVRACKVVKYYALPKDEGLAHIGFFQELERPITETHWQKKFPFCFSDIDTSHRRSAPVLGEHTVEVMKELLGLSNADIERLEAEGVIGGSVKAFA